MAIIPAMMHTAIATIRRTSSPDGTRRATRTAVRRVSLGRPGAGPVGLFEIKSATVMVWTSEVWLGFGARNCQCDGTPFVDPRISGDDPSGPKIVGLWHRPPAPPHKVHDQNDQKDDEEHVE